MRTASHVAILSALLIVVCSCDSGSGLTEPVVPEPGVDVVRLPVVVHVVHNGEAVGEGPNLSSARIERQIEILNEDFRRKEGTRGFNDDPRSDDARIEFVLAKRTPEGAPTDGIHRVDASAVDVPELGFNGNHYAQYAYWNPNDYINIWTAPLPEATACMVLGSATGPDTDLPGTDRLSLPGPGDADGILINWVHFGASDIACHARYGRTLTHEMGHFLGLLHTWGDKDCRTNDYCDDTPAVDRPVFGRVAFTACGGETVMIGNYMNWSDDDVMNMFTKDQIARMHYVLKHHAGRNALTRSAALTTP